ncbi:hypothetical protein VNI00_018033 [Paramarasmius palmivorus]|uniref:Uncharacterized protein n=1 Tax=Paramarasmius palmivorus TaxID=297713 RepID=A0AAW0B3H8_9AGAR
MSHPALLTSLPLSQRVDLSGENTTSIDGSEEEAVTDLSETSLLSKMPWFTGFVQCPTARLDFLPSDLKPMGRALLDCFRDAYSKHVFQDIVEDRSILTPNQKSADPLNAVVFGLRFLDVAVLVGSPMAPIAPSRVTVPRSVFEGQTGTLRNTNLNVVKALASLEATAFFINYMLQGHYDFPSQWKILVAELKGAAAREGVICRVASDLPPITRLRQPLFMALAVSPLVLLADISPTSANITRIHMIRAWFHYGSERPATLRKVEILLWKQLFDMARGVSTAVGALRQFVAEAVPLLPEAVREQRFFDPDLGEIARMPLSLSYLDSRPGKAFVQATMAAQTSVGLQEDVGITLSMDIDQIDGMTGERLRREESDLYSFDINHGRIDVDLFEGVPALCTGDSGVAVGAPLFTAGVLPSRVNGVGGTEDFCSVPSRLEIAEEETPSTAGGPARTSVARTTSSGGSRGRKGRKPVFGRKPPPPMQLYSNRKDLEVSDKLEDLINRCNVYQRRSGESELLVRMTGGGEAVVDPSKASLALSGTIVANVVSMDAQEYLRLDKQDGVAGVLAEAYILVTSEKQCSQLLDGRRLSSIGSCVATRNAVDVSLHNITRDVWNGQVSATFADFVVLLRSGRGGKSLYFPELPCTEDLREAVSVYSSSFSNKYCLDLPGYDLDQEFFSPRAMEFRTVSSGDVFVAHEMARGGFNTEICVEEGIMLLFLGTHREDFSFLSRLDSFRRSPEWGFTSVPDVLGLLLFAGDRMLFQSGTPYCVLFVEPTLCRYKHFYNSRSMDHCYWAIVHQLFGSSVLDETAEDYHVLLCRMALHWHDVIVNYSPMLSHSSGSKCERSMQVPDLDSLDGLMQVFFVLTLLELGTLLVPDRYADGDKWKGVERLYGKYRYVRREIMAALDTILVVSHMESGEKLQASVMWESFFVQQCVALVIVSRTASHPKVTSLQVESLLFQDLRRRILPVARAADKILHGGSHSMDKDGAFLLVLDDCASLDWSFRDEVRQKFTVAISLLASNEGKGGSRTDSIDGVRLVKKARAS